MGEGTPYDLKRFVEERIANFWSLPHSQVYREADRLARAGLLSERRERTGRRRRLYRLTAQGRAELRRWRDEPTGELPELRDLSLLKLFFGGEPARLAPVQRRAHERQLATYRGMLAMAEASAEAMPPGPARTLRAGVAHEEEWVEYWRALERG